MRRPLFAFLPAVLLAACAAGTLPPANPSRVTLLSDTLAVHFFDGSVCRADIRQAASGRFADYLKVGAPLNLILAVTATFIIPLFWPLQG